MLKTCKVCHHVTDDPYSCSGDLCPACQSKALDDLARQQAENTHLLDTIGRARAEAERSAIMPTSLHIEFVKERVASLAAAVVTLANVAEMLARRQP